MANLSEDIQCAGSNTRPPMLDRTDFASWQQRIRLYCRGKENGVNILKSIDEGPFQMGTFRETLAEGNEGALHLGPERPRVYSDLSPEDKDRYNADIRATNILLQGLPKDIYSLINHYTDAKDIWDNVKMLLEGSELTKEDRESQLYDDFEHFRQHKGETIHDYYVRFAKLINDMRNIKMTMSRMQLNSKFVNNMLPEWGRFVTAVKLNRGLRDSNYDQLYAYLKQHEAHANENKMLLDRFTQHTVDPLALISNVAPQQNQATVQDGRVVVQNVQGRQNRGQGNNARGAGTTGYGGAQNRVGNANPGQARQVKCYNCNADDCDAFDSDVDEAPMAQTMFMANLSSTDLVYDEAGPSYDSDILSEDLALSVDNVFQADDCDAFDSDVDEAPTTQTMFMANLSSADPIYDEAGPSYDSDILSEKQMYENFSAPSIEYLDSIFNRLQKIISQLAILGENISQEDLNLKFLRSLPSEWNTHVVVWRNKPDLDTMSIDDLYNNFKIVKQEVKGTASSSSSLNSHNMAFVSSPSSTNEVNTAYGVSIANLSDDTIYAFFASQPNGSQLVYEDLEQIHKDDIEEMYLKWQLALLSMRQEGHFARECRGPRNQDSRNRNQDSSRRTINVEETSSKVMVAIDGTGFD
ncbi:hypothetical protein Tco_0899052 [Tanacetum coccineum]